MSSPRRRNVHDPTTGSAPAVTEDSTRPTFAGRYDVIRLLGSGGMGAVYLARDRELDEEVALKVLRPELCTPDKLDLFRREVRLARRITHEGIARVHDIGEAEGVWYLTMEHVEGKSLAALLADGGISLERALGIAVHLARALSAAHARGVVHRDLKPDNVLVGDDGRIVVTDFGIARAVDPGTRTLTHGLPVGTPAYMAPEQVEARPDIDARADLYALGVVLYEMLTGKLPFVGPALEQAAMRLVRPPPDPRTHVPALDPRVAELVLRLLERDRDRRPASAVELEAALTALLRGEGPRGDPPRPSAELRRTAKGRPSLVDAEAELAETANTVSEHDGLADAPTLGAPQSAHRASREEVRAAVISDPSAAVDALELTLQARPDDPEVLTTLALANLRAFFVGVEGPAAYHRARDAAMRALELAPSRVDARHAVALCHLHAGDELTALRILLRLSKRSDASFVHESLGALLLEAGALVPARAHLERAVSVDAHSLLASFELVRLEVYEHGRTSAERRLALLETSIGAERSRQLDAIRLRIAIWHGDRRSLTSLAKEPGAAGLLPDVAIEALARGDLRSARGIVSSAAGAAHSIRRSALLRQIEAELGLLVGDDAVAISAIDHAIDVGLFDLAWLSYCPAFDAVRGAPPFLLRLASVRARAERLAAAYEEGAGPAPSTT